MADSRLLSIDQLRDIATICQAGSLRKAARQLGIAQPTLSARLARAENVLGAALFDRAHGRSEPTAIALMIAERAERLITEGNILAKDAQTSAQGKFGRLRVGCGPAPLHCFMSKVTAAMRQQAPQVNLQIQLNETRFLLQALKEGSLDVAICPMDPEFDSEAVISELLISSPLVIACAPGHAFDRSPPLTMGAVFARPFAAPVLEPMYLKIARDTFDLDLLEIPHGLFCSNYQLLVQLALNSDVFTLGPKFVFAREVAAGTLVIRALPAEVRHDLNLITRGTQLAFPALKLLRSTLREHVADPSGAPG